ncbi:protein meiotic P26-like [Crassostrea virginica]
MSLCELCTKWHLKFPALNDHKIAPFTEIDHTRSTPIFGVSNHCPKHQNEQVQLYCSQHEQPCCGLCGATEHKKCKNVELITTAAQSLKKSGKFNSLIKETKAFKEKLFLANSNLKNNISEIESQMDEKKSRFESEFRSMIQHLEKLKNDFLEEMSLTLKEGKEKLQGEIERLENGILCTNSCINGLEMAMNAANETEMVMKVSTSADTFRKLKKSHLKETNMKCEIAKTVGFKQIPDMQRIAFVNLDESASLIEFEVGKISLSVFKQLTVEKGNISSGFVLSGGNFLAVNETEGTCLMYDEEWKCHSVINNLVAPQDITQNEEGIFVTIPVLNRIEVFSSRHFQHIRNKPISDPRKITSFE